MDKPFKLFIYSLPFILLDSITKALFRGENFVIKGLFGVRYAVNTGTSFSLFQNQNFLFILVTIAVILSMFIYFKKFENYGFFAVILITSGAIGNLLDRLFYGHVQDFIYIRFWPTIFNFADIFLLLGVILLIVYFLRRN